MRNFEEAHGIHALRLYDGDACREMTDYLRRAGDWERAQIRAGRGPGDYRAETHPEVRSGQVLSYRAGQHLRRSFELELARHVEPFVERVWGLRLTEHSSVQVIRYGPGDHYRTHRDASLDMSHRYFTVLCYLNDGFGGGRTIFPSLAHSVRPESGKAVIFPAAYFHSAEPVEDGEKFLLAAWMHGPAAIRWV